MAGIVKKTRKNGVSWYLVLTPNQAVAHGFEKKRKWIGPYNLKEEARKARNELDKTIKRHSEGNSPTLEECYQKWLSSTTIRESTIDLYKSCWVHLEPFRYRHVDTLKRSEIKEFLEGLPFSKSRVKSIRVLLNHCFKWALNEGNLEASPMHELQIKYKKPSKSKEIRHWTEEQAKRFLEHQPKTWDLFYRLALHTGARRGELLALKWDNIDFDRSTLRIEQTFDHTYGFRDPKTEQSKRTVSLRQQELNALKQNHHESLVYVFQRADQIKPVTINTIQKEFYQICDTLGLPHIGLHGLRHTSATIAISRGEPIETVAKRLGHSKVAITYDVYRHILPEEDQNVANTLGEALD